MTSDTTRSNRQDAYDEPASRLWTGMMGFASIINLRLATEQGADIEGHAATAKAAGIPYHHIPFSASAPDPAAVDTFLKTIGAPGVQPAFIH